jgi:hypothetical protein
MIPTDFLSAESPFAERGNELGIFRENSSQGRALTDAGE